MLLVLSTINPEHLFFGKDFCPKEIKLKAMQDELDNSDGVFSDIPSHLLKQIQMHPPV